MKTSQFINLMRHCQEECAGLSVSFNVRENTVGIYFRKQDTTSGVSGSYSFTCEQIADFYANGHDAAYIVERAQWYVESEWCERCETFEQDREIVKVVDDYCCFDCFDNMISAAEYDAHRDNVRFGQC